MTDAALDLQTWRRRVARIVRRAESHPERGALLLKGEVTELLVELRRLARAEPAVVLEVLLFLLERLQETIGEIEDASGFAASLLPEITGRVRAVIQQDARTAENRVEHAVAVARVFRLWQDDAEGWYQDLGELLLETAVTPAGELALHEALVGHIGDLPLVFPPALGASDDIHRALLLAERHRSERLLGELLARREIFEYAVIVARDHHRRTGDALDLVTALRRAGHVDQAIRTARTALASPRSFQRQRLQELLDDMQEGHAGEPTRETRREVERSFIRKPSLKAFRALEQLVPSDQWERVRRRVLTHLQKHQKAPTLVFQLYMEEGDIQEADGLAVVQPVDPDVLVEEALKIAEEGPSMAAGWILLAAHHRTGRRKPSLYPAVVQDLLAVRDLSHKCDQIPAFGRALQSFRERYAGRRRLLQLLDEAGL